LPDFVPDLPVILAFTVAGFVLFVTPGPDMSLWLARTISGGRRAGLAAAMGTNLGCCVHSLLAAFGISVLINASPVAFNAMKVVGALYLLFLAVQMLRHGTVLNVAEGGPRRDWPILPTLLTGVLVNLSNPKVVLFFITFLPGFVSAADPHAGGKLMFLGLYFVAINVVLSSLLIAGAEGLMARLRSNPRILRVIDYLFAGVFGLFAVTILKAQARG
jgi:threonine/homoserine/homoserine lactone efflux protein